MNISRLFFNKTNFIAMKSLNINEKSILEIIKSTNFFPVNVKVFLFFRSIEGHPTPIEDKKDFFKYTIKK